MTAIEWLTEKLRTEFGFAFSNNILEEAKEMEKQQIENCAIHFTNYAIDCIEGKKEIVGEKQFEQYYNETFKK
jgi:hypothetical protein